MSELIDTTEMYLRTVWELREEGIVPLRARIAERLHHSGPTVSQTVARMERDGLLRVDDDRHIELTEEGLALAMRVMRKHRLAERLLTDVIGLDWRLVHDEACRWEHVISDEVEHRLVDILKMPVESPYGNPIPGMDEFGAPAVEELFRTGAQPLSEVVGSEPSELVVTRLSEHLQSDLDLLAALDEAGVRPGVPMTARSGGLGVILETDTGACEISNETTTHMFVARA
ncbi:metal-dependent transcriptional regulator [Enemella sp. A6]|uniref:metal-dependent transcriptional regulator n=1 Tax=Enemella sp. A6 TaxID=3440152 RepID=UPI003EC0B738